jgi:hypothetical protein
VTSSPVWTPDLNATTGDIRWSLFEDDSYGADRRPSPRLAALLLPAPLPVAANSSTVAGRVADPDLDPARVRIHLGSWIRILVLKL